MYFLHGVALELGISVLVMLPVEVVTLRDFLLDLRLDLYDVFLLQTAGSRLVLLTEYADVVAALKPTWLRR